MPVAPKNCLSRPRVCVAGDYRHSDFTDVVAQLCSEAEVTFDTPSLECPELILVAHSRPGVLGEKFVDQLRRAAPLAGVVVLLGSWCEGRFRASRPAADLQRLYWYQFAPWWRRQMERRAARRCPEWAQPDTAGPPSDIPQSPSGVHRGAIVLGGSSWDTADALSAVLRRHGYSTIWQSADGKASLVRGAAAGLWDGGQLDDRETGDLAAFCQRLSADSAPVIALLDFPRRESCEVARRSGAAAILGKPWLNVDLMAALQSAQHGMPRSTAA